MTYASVEEIVLNPENAFANRATQETRIIRNMRPITRPTRRTRKNEKFRETNVIPRSRNENATNTKSNLFHPSDQYGFQPKPYIFITASTKKAKVKI